MDSVDVTLRRVARGQCRRCSHLDDIRGEACSPSRWSSRDAGKRVCQIALTLRHGVAAIIVSGSAPVVRLQRRGQQFTPTDVIRGDGTGAAADGDRESVIGGDQLLRESRPSVIAGQIIYDLRTRGWGNFEWNFELIPAYDVAL